MIVHGQPAGAPGGSGGEDQDIDAIARRLENLPAGIELQLSAGGAVYLPRNGLGAFLHQDAPGAQLLEELTASAVSPDNRDIPGKLPAIREVDSRIQEGGGVPDLRRHCGAMVFRKDK